MANKKPLTNTNGIIREFSTGDSISVKFGGTGKSVLPKDNIIVGNTTDEVRTIKFNFDATVPPSPTDDINSNYVVGSKWYDIANHIEYTCLDNTENNAIWKSFNPSITVYHDSTLTGDGTISSPLSVVAGSQGYQGNQGNQGADGANGADGIGSQGYQGNQGNQGANGADGADGIGSQGYQGYQGNQGANGADGADGIGSQGYQGNQGNPGADGADGIGSQGYQGNQGNPGVQGPGVGEQGPQGYQGNQGATPSTANLVANVSDSYQVTSIQVVTALPAVGDRVTGRLYFVLSA